MNCGTGSRPSPRCFLFPGGFFVWKDEALAAIVVAPGNVAMAIAWLLGPALRP
jgi:hypothetical protein